MAPISKIEEELLALAKFPDENPNPVFRVSKDGTILYANSASIRLLYAWDVEIDQPLPDHLKPALKEVFSTGYPKEIEIDNQGRIFLFTIVPVAQRDYAYLYAQDITERKRLDQLKDDFVSTVSHELRMPLAIIKEAVGNLKDGIAGALTEKQAAVVEIAGNNVNRLQRLISDLLDIARLESGAAKVRFDRVDLVLLIGEVVQNFLATAKKQNLVLKTKMAKKLPPAYADGDMVHQVLNNLVDNAIRYAKKTVVVEVAPVSNAQIRVSVIDDGTGVETAHLETIFNKFHQVNRPKGGAGYKGTGLGLTICKEIIERHGGKIWAEATAKNKTQFHFTLPIYDENQNLKTILEYAFVEAKEHQKSLVLLGLSLADGNKKKWAKMAKPLRDEIQSHVLRKTDSLFQTGENGTFLLILPEANHKQALIVKKRIEKATQAFRKGLSFQFDLALYPEDAKTPEALLQLVMKKNE